MAAAWLPPDCRDEELSTMFETKGNGPDGTWNYFADSNRTVRITVEEVSMLADQRRKFYTDWEWHVGHCLYYWHKDFRSKSTKVTVEKRYATYGHLSHCEDVIYSDKSLTSNAGVALNATSFL